MDRSALSEYENVTRMKNSFSDSVIYQTIDNVLSTAGSASSKLFCPFCVEFFEYKFSLMDHLKDVHNGFLLQASSKILPFEECPFCSAKFYGKHLTTKHVLLNHSKVVMELYLDQKTRSCLFCALKFKTRSHSKFTQHVEEQHFLMFDEVFQEQFLTSSPSDTTKSSEDFELSKDFNLTCDKFKSQLNYSEKDFVDSSKMICYDLTDLKQQLENIKVSPKKSILKSGKNKPLKDIGNLSKSSVRRVLRFDLPDSPDDEDNDNNKENSVLSQNLKVMEMSSAEQSLLCSDRKKRNSVGDPFEISLEEPQYCSTPNSVFHKPIKKLKTQKCSSFKSYIDKNKSELQHFKCGKCAQCFQDNKDLVCHMKDYHNKFTSNLLQPCYQCAICNAKFFKNRYLKKHSKFHKKSIF